MAVAISLHSNAVQACPKDFPAFLTKFEQDESFQLLHTRNPVAYWHVDRDDPDMKMKRTLVPKSRGKEYERYPTREYQEKLKIERTIESSSPQGCTVRLGVADSDMYAVDFEFLRVKSGWLLVAVRDNSL
jgi:hypothetical protein